MPVSLFLLNISGRRRIRINRWRIEVIRPRSPEWNTNEHTGMPMKMVVPVVIAAMAMELAVPASMPVKTAMIVS